MGWVGVEFGWVKARIGLDWGSGWVRMKVKVRWGDLHWVPHWKLRAPPPPAPVPGHAQTLPGAVLVRQEDPIQQLQRLGEQQGGLHLLSQVGMGALLQDLFFWGGGDSSPLWPPPEVGGGFVGVPGALTKVRVWKMRSSSSGPEGLWMCCQLYACRGGEEQGGLMQPPPHTAWPPSMAVYGVRALWVGRRAVCP